MVQTDVLLKLRSQKKKLRLPRGLFVCYVGFFLPLVVD
jgi:hypothetical protein